ncbi:hypothetical protein FIBSPDRAFT_357971 [Athelia psychrophila]|uniref:Uncharacterized protein n=1 Tax=Athelia psychrophila TaxID=1759441 RepID=A0A166PJ61_9AGAM|nr:hypothetical protein FIBSPDRAFT_357971 [Fibularhizoctonia sp. CBS 109695]
MPIDTRSRGGLSHACSPPLHSSAASCSAGQMRTRCSPPPQSLHSHRSTPRPVGAPSPPPGYHPATNAFTTSYISPLSLMTSMSPTLYLRFHFVRKVSTRIHVYSDVNGIPAFVFGRRVGVPCNVRTRSRSEEERKQSGDGGPGDGHFPVCDPRVDPVLRIYEAPFPCFIAASNKSLLIPSGMYSSSNDVFVCTRLAS